MVTILPKEHDWADAFQSIGQGVSQGYQNRADEMALQKTIGGLGDNPTPRQILDAVTGTKTYNPQSKQNLFKNYLGAAQFEEIQKQHKAVSNEKKLKQDLDEAKAKAVKRTEKGNAEAVIDASEISEEEKQVLRSKIEDEEIDLKGVKEVVKPKKTATNDFEKGLAKENVKSYTKSQEDLTDADRALRDLQRVDELREKLSGPAGYVKAFNPFNEDAAEINALGFGVIKPIVKIFNPSGPIAQKKLEQLEKKYGIHATDSSATIKGKTAALRRYATDAKKLAEKKIAIITEHNGNPPLGTLSAVDKMGQELLDTMAESNIPGEEIKTPEGGPAASKFKGKTVKFPDGKQYYSDGEVWRAK